ncbi:hypothetical protein [Candidatus Nitrosocosmicus sp. SS]|uniref:hypothetical protein n=1 Tax=Candidatus Nitrosocosmicus agrestis TaxID=2563600 RepID=UPI0012B5EFED|nr:hypothetical protein [Candidatus Nitrosocosmicus sp. SS]
MIENSSDRIGNSIKKRRKGSGTKVIESTSFSDREWINIYPWLNIDITKSSFEMY